MTFGNWHLTLFHNSLSDDDDDDDVEEPVKEYVYSNKKDATDGFKEMLRERVTINSIH